MKDEMSRAFFIWIVMTFLSFMLIMPLSSALEFLNVVDYPDPIKAGWKNITIVANVSWANFTVDSAILKIETPFGSKLELESVQNSTYQNGTYNNITEFVFTYFPAEEGTYWYHIMVNDSYGNTADSGYYKFQANHYPIIDHVVDDGPTKFGDGNNITVEAYVVVWQSDNISHAVMELCEPINSTCQNISMQYLGLNQGYHVFRTSFMPNIPAILNIDHWEREYSYRVYVWDNTSNVSVSPFKTTRAEDYPPELVDFSVAPPGLKILDVAIDIETNNTLKVNFTVYDVTNLTNSTPNINYSQLVLLDTYNGSYTFYNLTEVWRNGSYVVYNWSFNYTQPHRTYELKLYLTDSAGNKYMSKTIFFSDDVVVYRTLPINLSVEKSCCLLPVTVVIPNVLYEGQSFTVYAYVENCGSVPLNVTGKLDVYKERGNNLIFYEQLAGFEDYSFENLLPGAWDGKYFVRDSTEYDEGNYSAVLEAQYYSDICFNETNSSASFQVKKFGGHGPMDLIVIREMPPKINQPSTCESDHSTCNYADVRLILYNRGTQNLTNITFTDTIQLNISSSYPNPNEGEPLNVICNSTEYFNCSVEMQSYTPYSKTVAVLHVQLNVPILPREYVIIPYRIYPSPYTGVYDPAYRTKYTFMVMGTYTDSQNQTQMFMERMPYFNPPDSYVLNLVSEPAMDYDIVVQNHSKSELREARSFIALKPATFKIVARSISGDLEIDPPYAVNITIPPIWRIENIVDKGDCENITYANYGVDTLQPYVLCNLSKVLRNGESISFTFNATSFIDEMFLLPAYSGDTSQYLDIEYLPGLFTLAKRPQNETPTPKPTPQPVPQPVPTPTPQPTPMPKPKVEIVLTPIEDNYTAYQGQMVPTYFWIENIGNVTANNISIEPVLPSEEWNFSPTYVDVLRPGEKVNRTLFITPGENTPPGLYIIPVRAMIDGEVADLAYIWVKVLFGKWLAKIEILEAPTEVEIEEYSNLTIPILLKNVGRKDLHNVVMRLENVEECISYQASDKRDIKVNDTASMGIRITAKKSPARCRGILIVSSDEQAYAFTVMDIVVVPRPSLIPLKWKWAPIVAILWTLLLIFYASERKKKRRMGEVTTSPWPKIIAYTLLVGEIILIIYTLLWVFGVVSTMF